MLKYLPSCYSALSFLRAHCSYILLKKNYFKAFSLFFSLKNIFYFSLFFFYSFLLLCSDLPFLSSSFYFFFFLALWNRSPCGSPLEAISRLGFEPMKLLPFQFFFQWVSMVGHGGGDLWIWIGGTVVRSASAWVGSLGYNFVLMAGCFC